MNDVNGDVATDVVPGPVEDLAIILSALLGTAEATKLEETAVRRAAALRIAELEKGRVRAYRRHHLVQMLGSAATDTADREAALAAQTAALASRLDWDEGMTLEQREMIVAMEPLMIRVAEAAGVPSPARIEPALVGASDAQVPADLVTALETFERWFATRFEGDFFRVFERYTPDARGTDF